MINKLLITMLTIFLLPFGTVILLAEIIIDEIKSCKDSIGDILNEQEINHDK